MYTITIENEIMYQDNSYKAVATKHIDNLISHFENMQVENEEDNNDIIKALQKLSTDIPDQENEQLKHFEKINKSIHDLYDHNFELATLEIK